MLDALVNMRRRLKRRNLLLDEVRMAYLKDVVIVRDMLRKTSRDKSENSTRLDLKPTLSLYAPSECTLALKHGQDKDAYGGYVEIVHHESRKVVELSQCIEDLLKLEQASRLKIVDLDLRSQQDRLALVSQEASNRSQRSHLCNEIHVLKERLSHIDESENENLRRTRYRLQTQLDQAEARIRELSLVIRNNTKTQYEAGQISLQLLGKEHQIGKLERQLAACGLETSLELKRHAQTKLNLSNESKRSHYLAKEGDVMRMELSSATQMSDKLHTLLEETRRSEAEFSQQLSDLRVEYTDAMQREEVEQEHLRLQLEQVKARGHTLEKEIDQMTTRLVQTQQDQQHALAKATNETRTELEDKHSRTVGQMQEEIMKFEERSNRVEAKLKLEQDKRAYLEGELHSLRLELQRDENKQITVEDESKKLSQIASVLAACPQLSYETVNDAAFDTLLDHVVTLVDTLKRITAEKHTMENHLEQYKAKAGAVSSQAKLVSIAKAEDAVTLKPDALSQLQADLDRSLAEKEHVESKTNMVVQELELSQANLIKTNKINIDSRDRAMAAMASLRTEVLSELESAQSFVRSKSSSGVVEQFKVRIVSLEKKIGNMEKRARNILDGRSTGWTKDSDTSAPAAHDAVSMPHEAGRDNNEYSVPKSTTDQLASAMSFIAGILKETFSIASSCNKKDPANNFDSAIMSELIAQHYTGSFDDALQALRSASSLILEDISVEVHAAHKILQTFPEGVSYSDMAEKISTLEQGSREIADTTKKHGREEELQRLKQRSAAQQNFILELQEELGTVKGLVFAADEIKRQYGEIEEKYRLLENEFTEKAETEVNARKAKERLELQLTLANADITSLSHDKETLMESLRDNKMAAESLESKLAHVQQNYENVMQREQSRLDTNKDIQTQFNPAVVDEGVQTEFKTPDVTLRQINSYSHIPHRRLGLGLVTPTINPGQG
mmetsp:Transcript_31668/g.97870  ORF Transcript_31668/g.97870 Transcript_31668/m.97870 type:complete len:958 (+) Transcript_31668:4516-7389(+)